MSLVPKTPAEIVQQYGEKVNESLGPNVLQSPTQNRTSNMVRFASMVGLSLSDIEQKVEAIIVNQNPNNLEGIALTNHAAGRGVYRKTGVVSKAVLVVTGQQGSLLESGALLYDRYGTEWETREEILLQSQGLGCAFATGIVYCTEAGAYTLNEDELVHDVSATPFIYAATNGQMLEIGGSIESDESLRNRLLSRGPLANVIGTVDNALSAIAEVEGVNFVRFEIVDSCIGSGPMFVVHGGVAGRVCDSIIDKASMVCNMVGTTECGGCTDVRFQRPCPIALCIEVTRNAECAVASCDDIAALMMSVAPSIARSQKIKASDFSGLHNDIDSVRLSIKYPALIPCPGTLEAPADQAEILTDPFDGSDILFATNETTGLCAGKVRCDTMEWVSSVFLNPWQYAVMDISNITCVDGVSPEDDCVICD